MNGRRAQTQTLTILIDEEVRQITVPHGANLRRTLLAAQISPYGTVTQKLNCGGRGLCATCGVQFETGEPDPLHWHDKLAQAGGYPRLACQISVDRDMTIRILTDKVLWGKLPR